ncbi:MAG: ABC transporter permease [Anaeroplasma bactoclasticum]|nr:ABC transporter permease [Anaeroplasma bactoclasticum]
MNNPYLIEKRKKAIMVLITQIVLLLVFLASWELCSRFEIIDAFLFSRPSKIGALLKRYIETKEIYKHIGISVLETILGLTIGTLVGIGIAIALWWNKTLAKICDPFLVVFNALPKTALAPIIIIWIGTGIKGITAVAISISLVLTIISAHSAFIQVEEEKVKMLQSFKASKWQILTKLILPANLTNLVSIVKINIGMSWVGVIVGEFIVSRYGIGYLIMYGSQVFNMDLVMMGVIVLAIISFLMYEVVNWIEKKIRRKRN